VSRLPQVRPDRLVRVFQRLGFKAVRQTGAHCFLRHADGRTLNIPMHQGRDVPLGTLRSILVDAKMSADELCALL
jgi:predicted RNA binding protein YcfA (HicA-like mRNA interferase family)